MPPSDILPIDLTARMQAYLRRLWAMLPREPGYWIALLALFLIYVIAARFGLSVFSVHAFAAPFWPPSGIALAAVFLYGKRLSPAIALGALGVNLLLGAPLLAALAIAIGNTGEALVGAYLFERFMRSDRPFTRLVDCAGLIAAALLAPIIAASIGVGALWLQGAVTADLFQTWFAWWSGDAVGIFALAPILIISARLPLSLPPLREIPEYIGMYALHIGMCLFLFWTPYFPYVYPLAIPLAWLAYRGGPRNVSIAVLFIAVIGVPATLHGIGPFSDSHYVSVVALQFAIAIASGLFLAMSAVFEERRSTTRGLESQVDTLEIMLTKTRSDDRAKTEFIAALAHELRNPLAPIVSSLELMKLQVEKHDIGGMPRLLDVMEAHVQTVTRLLDDLLDVSRISHKKFKLEVVTVDLGAVVNRSRETVESFYESRGHTLVIQVPSEPVWIPADPLRLQQIMVNILYNAGKYTNPGGRIELSARRDGDKAVIAIKDNGIGIPQFMLAKIFEPFVQLQEGGRVSTGLGIGLFLTKRLVEMHGGAITATSEGLGRGSAFVIHLPAPHDIQLPVYPDQGQGASVRAFDMERTDQERILIVDDNEPAALGLEELLTHRGHDVYTVFNGPSALSWLKKNDADVILLDIGLPGMTGYEVAERIRAFGRDPAHLLIAITGYGQKEDKLNAFKAGFDHHLTKPVSAKDIEELMQKGRREKIKSVKKPRRRLTIP
jgi:signal transduction histidine kinase/CheY-like chemotaxis protein